VVGVAYRGSIPLEDIGVIFDVSGGTSLRVRKAVTLTGKLSESQPARLRRAVEFCPVGKLFTKGSLEIEDEIAASKAVAACTAASPGASGLIPTGTVRARYLRETKEYDDEGELTREGEVEIYVECEDAQRKGRWALLIGHSGQGWMPAPVPAFNAALAASSITALRQHAPAAVQDGCQVEIARRQPPGDRDKSQADAAAGVVSPNRVLRRVVLPAAANPSQTAAVQAALERDPLSRALRDGNALADESIELRTE
jgi:hypothetical protein